MAKTNKQRKIAKNVQKVRSAIKKVSAATKQGSMRTTGGQDVQISGRTLRRLVTQAKASSSSEDVAQYEAALMNPFSEMALGARVPDSYAFPSEVRHVKMAFTVAPSSGNADFAVFPHPLYSLVSGVGVIAGGINTLRTVTNLTQRAVVSDAKMVAAFNNYRLVGGGIRIKFSNSYNSATGRLFIAVQPSPANLPIVSAGATNTDIYRACDLPFETISAGVIGLPTSILSFPYSMEIPCSELIGNGIEIPFRVSSAEFADWRETDLNANKGPSLVTTTGSTLNDTVPESYCMSGGWSSILVRGTNLSGSTPVLDVEVIYHLEGTPAVAASDYATDPTVLAGANTQPVVNVTGMFKALAKQSATPFAKIAMSTGKAILGKAGVASRAMRVMGFVNS